MTVNQCTFFQYSMNEPNLEELIQVFQNLVYFTLNFSLCSLNCRCKEITGILHKRLVHGSEIFDLNKTN